MLKRNLQWFNQEFERVKREILHDLHQSDEELISKFLDAADGGFSDEELISKFLSLTAGGGRLLCTAARSGHLEVVNRLLEVDAVKANVAASGNRVLRVAIDKGHLKVINRLLELNEVKKTVAQIGNWMLRLAVQNDLLEVVYQLLDLDNVIQMFRITNAKFIYEYAYKKGLLELYQRLMTEVPFRTEETIAQEIEMVESRTRPDCGTLKAYVDSCKEHNLSEQFSNNHVKVDEAFRCRILHNAANIPVKLTEYQNGVKHEFCFDYEILKQWYVTNNSNPVTRRKITWSDVEAAPDLVDKMQKAIHDAKQKAIDDATQKPKIARKR